MSTKKTKRLKRARKTRGKILRLQSPRLTVIISPKHTSAQVYSSDGARVIIACSTHESSVRETLNYCGNISAAQHVGKLLGERMLKAGVDSVAFDRSGYQYHGRVKALAEAVRATGVTV